LVIRGLKVALLIYLYRVMRAAAYGVLRITLPRTPLNKAETAVPSLRVVALTGRVVERRPRDIETAKESADGFQDHLRRGL
jgi:hypothetical protein